MKSVLIVRTGPLSENDFQQTAEDVEHTARLLGAMSILVMDKTLKLGQWKFSSLNMSENELIREEIEKLKILLQSVTLDVEVQEIQEEIIKQHSASPEMILLENQKNNPKDFVN